ncbi:MAG: tetratricopeptide repeat protein, partial [Chloroflexales bacterium]|nr:tetratricopeptide repeat protein [Chloroflexales bacterium]
LMRGLWSSGQRGAALEQYDMCRRVLSVELGIDPSPELTALYEQIRTTNSAEFPALRAEVPLPKRSIQHRTLGTQHAHNLPAQPTSFVGRAAEIAALRQAIPAARLLTLTGTGGCGKTRLALEIASALVSDYPDGVWLVELAPIQDAALVHQAVLAALGLRASSEQPADAFLSAALRAKHLLVVLDNCEHLVPACRQLAEQLLRDCPQLSIMATSREVLHVAGEAVWPVPPLSIPNSAALTPEHLVGYDGIQLFVERARAANVGFALTASNAPAVLQLCRRLDSIPLALELAAARVRHMDVETIAARLDDRFSLLKAGSHAAPRQQTLRAAIDWSYALLTEPERACFRQLAVFAGGFTLASAEAVVDAPNSSTRAEASVMDLLAQLIDKSLVVAEQRADGMRYRLLETMRAYALDTLAASGEEDAQRDRHAAHFLALAELAEPQLFGADQIAWLDRLTMEHANLRAALDWTANRGDVAAALRLVTALWSFWYTRGHYEEGRRRTLETLALPGAQAPTPTRARALNAAGALLWASDDAAAARPLLEEALTIGRAYADEWNIGWALLHLGMIAYHEGDNESARPLLESGLASCRAAGSAGRRGVGWALIFLGDLALGNGQAAQAQAHFAESVACLREMSDHALLAYPLRRLGLLAMEQGDYRQAAALCTESLRSNLAVDDRLAVAACLAALAAIAVAEGLQATDESQRVTDVIKPERTREIQVPIIDAIANDNPGIFQVNVPNNGAIHGIADDVVVEGKALVDASGAKLLHVGKLPDKLMHLVIGPRVAKAERELAAFKTGDYDLLVGCMLLDDHRTASLEQAERWTDAMLALPWNDDLRARFKKPNRKPLGDYHLEPLTEAPELVGAHA